MLEETVLCRPLVGAARASKQKARLEVVWRTAASPRGQLALGSLFVAASCLPLAFHSMFWGFMSYDDEGYVLLSLQHYLAGGTLYDQIFSQYGPAFYELVGSAFSLLHLRVTHSDGRLFTLAVWISASVLCGAASYRLGRNVPVALCCQLLVFLSLTSLCFEPMHPGGLTCLLLSGVVLAGSFLTTRTRPAVAAVIGALVALLVLTKINIGVFALVAVGFAWTATAPATPRWKVVRLGAAAAMLAVAPALTAAHWHDPRVWRYAVLVFIAAFTAVLTELPRGEENSGGDANLVASSAAFGAVFAAVSAWQLVRGTSPTDLVRGVLLDPLRMPSEFALPLKLTDGSLDYALPSAAACVLFVSIRKGWLPGARVIDAIQAPARLFAGALIWLVMLWVPSPVRFTVALPLLWIALAPSLKASAAELRGAGKTLLLALAVLQTLHAYPVAGSQQYWATFLFVPVGAVGIAEGWGGSLAALRRQLGSVAHAVTTGMAVLGVMALLSVSATTLYRRSVLAKTAYDAGVPMALPGTEWIRVNGARTRCYRWLVAAVSSRCENFLTLPGLNSLYLFTGSAPPTMLNATDWMALFDASKQAHVRDAFARRTGPRCVIRNRSLVWFWLRDRPIPKGPLVSYIDESFTTAQECGGYELMLQRSSD